jgi:D,D-heptose 1,7-bisphosphate phosphatase
MSEKAVFLDRDDTIIDDPGYLNDPSQVKLINGAGQGLAVLRKMGYKLIIVSNQSAVARGIVTEEVLGKIHQQMKLLLSREGASVDAIYYCPYHPDGVIEEYRKVSDMRKPEPGMLLKAAKDMDIDLERSWMIGDKYDDVKAGQKAGCKTILINNPAKPKNRGSKDPVPDKQAVNIKEAVNIIRMMELKGEAEIKKIKVRKGLEDKDIQKQKLRQEDGQMKTSESNQTANKSEKKHVSTVRPIAKVKDKEESLDDSNMRPRQMRHMIEDIVKHLENIRRDDLYDEFSIVRFFAGIIQAAVFGLLLLSLWFLMDHDTSITAVHTCLIYAGVLQLVAIGFYVMRNH